MTSDLMAQARSAIESEDFDLADQIVRVPAEEGDAEAQYLLGFLFFTAAEFSKAEARVWLQRAAAQNHAEAAYWLSRLGEDSDSGPPENSDAREWLVRAAELGNAQAQRDVGCFHAIGEGGFPKDETIARLWYGRAAAQGHADAQYNYGCMLLFGEGGPVELETGMALIREAADHGDIAAIRHLADETQPIQTSFRVNQRQPFKSLMKWIGIALALVVVAVLSLIGVVEIQNSRTQRQVDALVRELAPGTPFQLAVDRLGPPSQVIVDREEMVRFNKFNGPSGGRSIAGQKLHVFFHKAVPFRWVLVFTDDASQTIRQASWESM